MHKLDQPEVKNSTAATAGDAAVQIGGEAENTIKNNDLFHVEQENDTKFKKLWAKRDAILKGAHKEQEQYPSSAYEYAAGELAWIVVQLTSTNKLHREAAKKEVRCLVELGKRK